MASRYSAPLRAYRIGSLRHPVFDGEGAKLFGSRWNSPGNRVIYASLSYASALLEILVHANIGELLPDQVWIEIDIPEGVSMETVEPETLPGWDAPDLIVSQAYGDQWFREQRSCVLVVPAAPTGGIERNLVINQQHPEFRMLRASEVRPIRWDPRLLRRS